MPLNLEALLAEPTNFTAPDRMIGLDAAGLAPGGLQVGVFEPEGAARGVLVFFHGGGGSGRAYGGLADRVRRSGPIAVLTPDLRGHGASGGPRGFAATPQTLWSDVDAVIDWARAAYPSARLFVGGHSSGGGLVVNWAGAGSARLPDVAGIVLAAPMLSARPNGFAKANSWAFMAYLASGRRLMTRAEAVRFDYPEDRAAAHDLVRAYSPGMSLAVTPRRAREILRDLAAPVLIVAAASDELFDMSELRAAAEGRAFEVVGGTHLSCLRAAASPISGFILDRLGSTADHSRPIVAIHQGDKVQ